jgi:sigma-B regulation protein RsbU (phosphoserine phosphatase)
MRTEVENAGTRVVDAGEVEEEQELKSALTVLLVEDNPGDSRLIQLMLEDAGDGLFEVVTVDHLEAALNRLAAGGIGLVLSDLSLPDSHGLETFTRLHAQAPHVPIIVLSGLNDTTLALQAVHEGAQDYLIKGEVEGQLLVRAMRYAVERKRMSEQLAHYAEELRAKNAQLEADFNMAREIQEMFLPQQYPTFPHSASPGESAIKFSHRYLPAAQVGGDFFNIFPITDCTAGVFICDVMGHGMRAALITAIMRGLLEELMPVAADAGKFLSEINRSLHAILKRTREPFLATAFYLVADVAAGEVRFTSAGHPSPYHVRRSKGEVQPLRISDPRHGPALGLFEKAVYPTCSSPVAPNDVLLLFTDGIYETTNPRDEEYGQERLLANVRESALLPTEQLLDKLLTDAQTFRAGPGGTERPMDDFEDDVCLVALDVTRVRS